MLGRFDFQTPKIPDSMLLPLLASLKSLRMREAEAVSLPAESRLPFCPRMREA